MTKCQISYWLWEISIPKLVNLSVKCNKKGDRLIKYNLEYKLIHSEHKLIDNEYNLIYWELILFNLFACDLGFLPKDKQKWNRFYYYLRPIAKKSIISHKYRFPLNDGLVRAFLMLKTLTPLRISFKTLSKGPETDM